MHKDMLLVVLMRKSPTVLQWDPAVSENAIIL